MAYRKEAADKVAEGVSDFDSWIGKLENAEQPVACDIHDPECTTCGS